MKDIFEAILTSDYFNLLIDFEIVDFSKERHREALRETLYATGIDESIVNSFLNELESSSTKKPATTKKTDKNKSPRQQAKEKGLHSIGGAYWSTRPDGPATHKTEDGELRKASPAEQERDQQAANNKNPNAKKTSGSTSTESPTAQAQEKDTEIQTIVLPAEPLTPGSDKAKEMADGGSTAAIIQQKEDERQKRKEKEKNDRPLDSRNVMVNGKNKAIKSGNPLETEVYKQKAEPSNQDYDLKTDLEGTQITTPYSMPDFVRDNPKIPARYVDILERMINTKATKDTAKYSYFSDQPGGAGQISAQAGELLAMVGTTLSDDEADQFYQGLLNWESSFISREREKVRSGIKSDYVKKDKSGNLIRSGNHYVDLTWIKAAQGNRTAILNRLRKRYGKNVEIVAGAWDTEQEVEALGMEDYAANKGFSTDVYFRVRKPNGVEFIDEVSLKKSTIVNFLNSGLGKFKEWDENLPEHLDQNVYAQKQRDTLSTFNQRYKDRVKTLIEDPNSKLSKMILRRMKSLKDKDIQKMVEEKDIMGLFQRAIDDTSSGKGSRDKSKILREAIWELAASGDQEAKATKKELLDSRDKIMSDSIKAIVENPTLKQGMLDEIKSEFPLKAVSDGEETMAIGELSLDRMTMEEIFGTHQYDEIKEHLSADPGPPPFLAYDVEGTNEKIPVAEISIREDGVGYGGTIKFEMKLHKDFGRILKEANKKVYGE